jgi:membrane-associated protein
VDWFLSVFHLLLADPVSLVKVVGLFGLVCIIFAETALLVGFFLPGDSLLIVAGLFAAKGDLSLYWLLTLLTLAAIVGDAVGFAIGHVLGNTLYQKEDSFFFPKKHIIAAQEFYEKHGGKTIIFARFIPIVRTFVPTVAGAARMKYRVFSIYNILGGFLWVFLLVLSGFYLGSIFGERINHYIHLLILSIIFISFLPVILRFVKIRKTFSFLSSLFRKKL